MQKKVAADNINTVLREFYGYSPHLWTVLIY